MKPTLAGSGRKSFRGNGRRRASFVGEPNVQRSVETGPAHIVQFRRQGAGRGGLSKNSTIPRAQIWGPTPNFKITSCVYVKGLQIPKIWRKNLGPFSRYEFSKFWRKIEIFGVRGILNRKNFTVDASSSHLSVCQIWFESVKLMGPFWPKNSFISVSPSGESWYIYYKYCRERTTNGVGVNNSSTLCKDDVGLAIGRAPGL